jgi:HEAT repeat protein
MKNGILIPLDRARRLLEKTRAYLADLEAFLANTPAAVTVLLDALPFADANLQVKMLPLLGYAGKDRVLWPLYNLMRAASSDDQVRRLAAVQLGLAASMSGDTKALAKELIQNLSHADAHVRSICALALGWEGNWSAVKPLMACLTDTDRDVQADVATALATLGDDRVFDLLTARLDSAMMEEQRSILLNLWRFAEHNPDVADVYLTAMEKISPDLRADALAGLAMVPLSPAVLDGYRRLLMDEDPAIRRQVLENLSHADPRVYAPLNATLRKLATDRDKRVRQAAIRLFALR